MYCSFGSVVASYFRGISMLFCIVRMVILEVGQGHFTTAGAGAFRNFKLLWYEATLICNMVEIAAFILLWQPTFWVHGDVLSYSTMSVIESRSRSLYNCRSWCVSELWTLMGLSYLCMQCGMDCSFGSVMAAYFRGIPMLFCIVQMAILKVGQWQYWK